MSTSPASFRRPRRGRFLTAGASSVALACILAACGSGTSDTSSSTTGGGSPAAAGDCGSVPTKAPQDPDGVLASLPKDVQANYNLYGTPVLASPWAKWKAKHAP